MTDMNNRSMNDNNENRNNDPKERMRKKVKSYLENEGYEIY